MLVIRQTLCVISLGLVLVGIHAPAIADSFDAETFFTELKIHGANVKLPAPSWQETANTETESETREHDGGTYFIREYVPKGTSFAEWKRLFAVFVQQSPQLTLDQFTAQSVGIWRPVCGETNYQNRVFNATENGIQMLIFCLDSPKGPAKYGYGPGIGEITAMALYQVGTTFVKIYQHWRGAKFEMDNIKSWPVGDAELASVVKRFAGIEVVPSGRSN